MTVPGEITVSRNALNLYRLYTRQKYQNSQATSAAFNERVCLHLRDIVTLQQCSTFAAASLITTHFNHLFYS